jgi:3-phenylpropionate/trans-cinnamate dioxygenase ferredoxin reductase subunit
MTVRDIVIIGGGLAAATAAEELRERGYDGSITLVAAERYLPHQRPPLSKGYLTGSEELDAVFEQPREWYDEHGVDLLLGTAARELDTHARSVVLDGGERLGYDRVLLATGAHARRLSIPGADASGIHYLRTIDDSESLRAALSAGGSRVVVVGSGWIGLEAAAAARGYGNDVTIIGRDEVPLQAALGVELGRVFAELHEEHGVQLIAQADVTAFEVTDGAVSAVRLGDRTLPADLVIVGVGAEPNVELAQGAALRIDNGVLTDEHLATEADGVFAAGDVANPFHPFVDRHVRNEHWANAIGGGKAAAANMLGEGVVYDDVPYFFTDQYDLGMEYAGFGILARDAEVVYRGDVGAREFIAFWQREGRVVAGMNVNVWDVSDDIQALIRSRRVVSADRLRDADVPLTEL